MFGRSLPEWAHLHPIHDTQGRPLLKTPSSPPGRHRSRRPRRSALISGVFASALALVLSVIPAAFVASAQAYTPPGNKIQLTFEGCRYYQGLVFPENGELMCPDTEYTSGNLGKGWNELDLVPFRLTAENTGSEESTFNVIIAADYTTDGKAGYDLITIPTVSDNCQIVVGEQLTTGAVTGGADEVIYRELQLTAPAGQTCEVNWYSRLALGAAQYPGSSLQAYIFESDDFSQGKRTIPIPVKEILPQTIDKDMTATTGSNYAWSLTKEATPATVTIDNTCLVEEDISEIPVTVDIDWTRSEAEPDAVTITTNVYATNPAARTITVNVTDKIYAGQDQSGDPIDTMASSVDVPANTTQKILTHTFAWDNPDNETFVNDVATATYTDKLTGVKIDGTTTAQAEAPIQVLNSEDATADVSDTETLSGPNGVTFSVASEGDGSFSNYTAGDKTVGPVDWSIENLDSSGSMTFDKTLYIPRGTSGTGTLSDTATLTTGDGLETTAQAEIAINVDTTATLTIAKTIPDILTGDETATFTFDVSDGEGVVRDDVPVTFTAGQTTQSVDVAGLVPGGYTVTENPATGWDAPGAPQDVDLSGTTCAGEVAFTNTVTAATASAVKVTAPAGSEGGWVMNLTRSGVAEATQVTTNDAGVADFGPLVEGSYTITETMKDGWAAAGQAGDCEFTVDYPRDSGKVFTCTLTNGAVAPAAVGTVTIVKEFNAAGSGFTGTFDVAYTCTNGGATVTSGTAALANGQSTTLPNLPLGTQCSVTEPTLPAAPAGWAFNPATFVPAGGQVTVSDQNLTPEVRVVNSIVAVSPVVASRPCPVNVKLVKPKPRKVGNHVVLIKNIKTRETRCELVRPAVVCVPLDPSSSGETAFCRTVVNRATGRVRIKANGYDAIRVTVRVKAKPKPAYRDEFDARTWRKSWILR